MKKRLKFMLRQQIESMTIRRIGPVKTDIQNQINWFYMMGAMSYKQNQYFTILLSDKYTEIMNDYEKRISDTMEAEYHSKVKNLWG